MAQDSPKNVQEHATQSGVFDQERISLIGIMGTETQPRAMLRLSSGKTQTVKPGDTVKGRTVIAIAQDQVRLQRGSKLEKLEMPKG
jgi:type IV pilus biogenesis protein PilP